MDFSQSRFLSENWPESLKIQEGWFAPTLVIEKFRSLITDSRWQKIEKVAAQRSASFVVVLENIYDRGNISAVMRSCEAFGFFEVHIIELASEFKESARVTQGADKWLNIYKWKSIQECLTHLKKKGYQIYATHLAKDSIEVKEIGLSSEKPQAALIFGNEKDGVSNEALNLCDGNVLIPMQGFTQSFNISVAAALCLQEAHKKSKPIDSAESLAFKATYILKSLDLNDSQIYKILKQT